MKKRRSAEQIVDGGRKRRRGDRVAAVQNGGDIRLIAFITEPGPIQRRPARHAPVSDQTRPHRDSPTGQRLRKCH